MIAKLNNLFRRSYWFLLLMLIFGIFLVSCGSGVSSSASTSSNSHTSVDDNTAATNALTTFCNALRNKDYNAAYNLLSGESKVRTTQQEFTGNAINYFNIVSGNDQNNFNSYSDGSVTITSCTVSDIVLSQGSGRGTVLWIFSNGTPTNNLNPEQFSLVKDVDNTWRLWQPF